ncbi:MAG: SagB/ThcOx family dehydrogenase [Acidobacteriota bacterium]
MKKPAYRFHKELYNGKMSVEEALRKRMSVRSFSKDMISYDDLGCLLWAAYGSRDLKSEGRTAPSAGACYPLTVYAVIGKNSVEGISEGIYVYMPQDHAISKHREGDARRELAAAALGQNFIADAPLSIAISADFNRTISIYGDRGARYVLIDLGHSAQNIYLEATSLGLGTVAVGAFRDNQVAKVLSLPGQETPLYIMPVGYPIRQY